MKIALIHEGNDRDSARLARWLTRAGHVCREFANAAAFLDHCEAGTCDLLLLPMPIPDAAEMLAAARNSAGTRLPVLLVADAADTAVIAGALEAGADDYVIKPLREREVLVRVGVLLSRALPEKRASARLTYGRVEFETLAGQALLDGRPVVLTKKEYALALLLFAHLGQPLSRATLMERLWSQEPDVPTRTLDTHVSRVRTKLALDGSGGYRLAPVYGYGYVLEAVHSLA